MDISWMDRWMECMHAEHLERSAHASWTVFLDTLAAVSVNRVDATVSGILEFGDSSRASECGSPRAEH